MIQGKGMSVRERTRRPAMGSETTTREAVARRG